MGKRGSTMIVIGLREGDHVTIEATSHFEGGWRSAHVSARCGPWTGHFTAQFLRGELAKFGKEIGYLCEKLRPVAELRGGEHYLEMKIEDDGKGRTWARGFARERLGAKTGLQFEFEVQRGTLGEIAKALIEA